MAIRNLLDELAQLDGVHDDRLDAHDIADESVSTELVLWLDVLVLLWLQSLEAGSNLAKEEAEKMRRVVIISSRHRCQWGACPSPNILHVIK